MARRRPKDAARRLRVAVDRLPSHTKEAMLRGIDSNRIIVGAYVDPSSGGICPMLAAHRNGGRTDVSSFALAWDAYTNARGPRRATRREVQTLRALLESSLGIDRDTEIDRLSITELANQLRAERERLSCNADTTRPAAPTTEPATKTPAAATGETHRAAELRHRTGWAWLRPTRRYDDYKDLLAAAEEELSEQRAADLLGAPGDSTPADSALAGHHN